MRVLVGAVTVAVLVAAASAPVIAAEEKNLNVYNRSDYIAPETVEKFVAAGSIDPLYYDTSYFVAPDGDAGRDVYAVLYEAIEKSGKVALPST